jgi:hypothetical protein
MSNHGTKIINSIRLTTLKRLSNSTLVFIVDGSGITFRSNGPAPLALIACSANSRGPLPAVVRGWWYRDHTRVR